LASKCGAHLSFFSFCVAWWHTIYLQVSGIFFCTKASRTYSRSKICTHCILFVPKFANIALYSAASLLRRHSKILSNTTRSIHVFSVNKYTKWYLPSLRLEACRVARLLAFPLRGPLISDTKTGRWVFYHNTIEHMIVVCTSVGSTENNDWFLFSQLEK